MKYVYGPVPSRRLGLSLGVSPIPNKTCNYSCIYCQLGRTTTLSVERKLFYPVEDILDELKKTIVLQSAFDVITIVGEGEPTLYLGLGSLITKIRNISKKPIAVITNGALLSEPEVRNELKNADIVLPSLDAATEQQFRSINRPHKHIEYSSVIQGLVDFSMIFEGELWIEIMLIKGLNDDRDTLEKFSSLLKRIKYSRLYLNSPVRPPAETSVCEVNQEQLELAVQILGGTPINRLSSTGFYSPIKDDFEAVLSIIQRHPMNQFEILDFLRSRNCCDSENIIARLNASEQVLCVYYKGYNTYRVKPL